MPKRLRFTLVLALLVFTALALDATGASAAPKEVAYVCHGEDICLLDPDNPSEVVNLTDDGTTSYDEDPTWSPDGKRLAFVARFPSSPARTNIYTMEPDAPGQTVNDAVQVTHFTNGTVADELAWSPDGSKIAFVTEGGSRGNLPLWVVNADGSSANATEIPTAGGVDAPTWSADSGKIAFGHNHQIYTVNGDVSGPVTPLPGATGDEPAWSPDGSRIAYGREFSNVQIIGAAGGAPLATISSNSQFPFLSWSPSGTQLAYHEQTGEDTYFRIVNADGSGNHGLPIVHGLNANGPAASWSPDGSRLVFQGYYFGEGQDTNEVYIATADGSGSVTALTPNQVYATEPAWRPKVVVGPPGATPPGTTPPGGPPQVITPSGGSNGPLPGPTIKPKLVWFTNRIPWNGSPYVPMLSVSCGGPVCNVGGEGKSKSSAAAGLSFSLATTASAKPKAPKKPKAIVVARGKVHVPSNQKRVLKLKLTKLAIAILKKAGKLKMTVTVTTTIVGQAPVKASRTVELFVKPKKP